MLRQLRDDEFDATIASAALLVAKGHAEFGFPTHGSSDVELFEQQAMRIRAFMPCSYLGTPTAPVSHSHGPATIDQLHRSRFWLLFAPADNSSDSDNRDWQAALRGYLQQETATCLADHLPTNASSASSDVVIGTVAVHPGKGGSQPDDPNVAVLAFFYVDVAFRGHGHGRRLHTAAVQWARQEGGYTSMWLETSRRQLVARQFYLRRGWRVIQELQNAWEDSLMVKELVSTQTEDPVAVASWETIVAYGADQAGEIAAGRGPRRAQLIEERYRRYSKWCEGRGHTGVQLVLAISMWQSGHSVGDNAAIATERNSTNARAGVCAVVALEPNIVPYECEEPVEHWILWYHPNSTDPSTDLDPDTCAAHVRQFISLNDEELVVFQNALQFRSVPEIAHAHAFIRPLRDESRRQVAQLRGERRIRSPWVEAERIGGRGAEVGF